MATTSIWSVKGWLGKVLIYVENPKKTENPDCVNQTEITERNKQSLDDVIAYAVNTEKTRLQNDENIANEGADIMQQYVSGINCSALTARTEMMAVKKRFGKEDGIMAFHGYQSFAQGECTPDMAHEIGKKLAEELWGNRYQVIVATHLDKESHLHNHFVVNSISFVDGKRFFRSNQDYRDMRQASDRLCKEYGLSVLKKETQKKGKHYSEWRAEHEQKPSYHGMVKADVDEVILQARTEKQFFYLLKEKGYAIKIGKDITIRASGRDRGVKLARNYGEDYTMEAIRKRILSNPLNRERQEQPVKKVYRVIKVKGVLNKKRKIGGLRGLYLQYCYRLGILPKRREPVNPQEVHIIFREDLCRLNTITEETKLLCCHQIDTLEQLFEFRDNRKDMMDDLVEQRFLLRHKKRSVHDAVSDAEIKNKITALTEQIEKYRKEIHLCDGIAERSIAINKALKEYQQEVRKEEKQYEYSRGCCRPGR